MTNCILLSYKLTIFSLLLTGYHIDSCDKSYGLLHSLRICLLLSLFKLAYNPKKKKHIYF